MPEESRRLSVLQTSGILDTPGEEGFDRVTRLAAQVLGMPIAVVSFVDRDRLWFKSAHGTDLHEIPRQGSFCCETIRANQPLVVTDALADSRFQGHPLVCGAPHLRFYAGAPIRCGGVNLGALVVMDTAPRQLDEAGLQILTDLAGMVSDQVTLRTSLDRSTELQAAAERNRHALALSEARYRGIFEEAADGILTIDQRGVIQDVNLAACRMFGYGPGDVVGRNVSMLCPEPHRTAHDGYLHNYLSTGEARIIGKGREVQGQRKDGSLFPLHLAVSEVMIEGQRLFTGILYDLSALHAARARAEESQRILNAAIESLSEGFALYDADDRLVICNRTYREMYHAAADILVPGVHFQTVIEVGLQRGMYPEAVGREDEFLNDRLTFHRTGGVREFLVGERWIKIAEQPLDSGGVVGTRVDITDLKRAKEQAEKANKAKSDFLSNMSHELRTPLNAILGFAQMLDFNAREPLTPTQKSCVDHVIKGGKHLLQLINEILDLARIEAGRVDLSLEDVVVADALKDCLELIGPVAAEAGIALAVPPGPDGLTVRADYTRFKQVMLNLLSNAVKYNRPQGTIFVTIETEGRRARLAVRDTGRGIPAHRMAELFQPFSRLGAEATAIEGTGIGLTLTRQLVVLMNGEIGVESQEGQGSTFWVELPLAAQAAATAGPQDGRGAPGLAEAEGPAIRVLYVEDNPANLQLVEMLVAQVAGMELISAPDAEIGIQLAQAHQPDVVLMDLNLPGMSGLDAMARLKQSVRTHDIPVIALTANATQRDIEKGKAAGFADYLTKPIQIDQVLAAIRGCVREVPR